LTARKRTILYSSSSSSIFRNISIYVTSTRTHNYTQQTNTVTHIIITMRSEDSNIDIEKESKYDK